jgi:hypothetical protein
VDGLQLPLPLLSLLDATMADVGDTAPISSLEGEGHVWRAQRPVQLNEGWQAGRIWTDYRDTDNYSTHATPIAAARAPAAGVRSRVSAWMWHICAIYGSWVIWAALTACDAHVRHV